MHLRGRFPGESATEYPGRDRTPPGTGRRGRRAARQIRPRLDSRNLTRPSRLIVPHRGAPSPHWSSTRSAVASVQYRPRSLHNNSDSAAPLLKRHHTATCDTVGHSPGVFFEKSEIAAWTEVNGVDTMDRAHVVKACSSAVARGDPPQRIGATADRGETWASSSFAAARSNPAQRYRQRNQA